MFANNTPEPVAYAEEDVQKDLIQRYHPGEERLL